MGAIILVGLLAILIGFDLAAWRWGIDSTDSTGRLRGARDD